MNVQELMQLILEVRYTDLEKEKELCKELLDLSETNQDIYGCAFANVYLFDSILTLGVYSECDFILSNAICLCRENNFDDLLLMLCNLVGLYYLKLNDEQTALQYFLEGLQLAETIDDYEMLSKLNNNIGTGFSNRGSFECAKGFFEKACQMLDLFCTDEYDERRIRYYCNLAEIRIVLGELEGIEQELQHCTELAGDNLYNVIRVGCAWCSYYGKNGERQKCIEAAEKLLKLGIGEYEDRFFTCDMLYGTAGVLIESEAYELAEKFLSLLEDMIKDSGLLVCYRILCLKISYMEKTRRENELNRLYHEYYDLEKKMIEMDNQMCAQSIFSNIQLSKCKQEREAMKLEKEKLEMEGSIDELTGLYNRRYFNIKKSEVNLYDEQQYVGMIIVDIDYFKQYNDFYGHYMGDFALKEVAEVLFAHAGEKIMVSRYGGDEFVCVCTDMNTKEVDAYIKEVRKELEEKNIPHEKSECSHRITLSIGYCNGRIGKAISADHMLKKADDALSKVKKSGKNGFFREEWL